MKGAPQFPLRYPLTLAITLLKTFWVMHSHSDLLWKDLTAGFSKQWFYIELEYFLDHSGEYYRNSLELQRYIEADMGITGDQMNSYAEPRKWN